MSNLIEDYPPAAALPRVNEDRVRLEDRDTSVRGEDGSLSTLISNLHELFSVTEVDMCEVQRAMEQCVSRRQEWAKYAKWDPHRSYTRNLVDAGNGRFNLMILCWNEGEGSSIHDHADSHCLMKCLAGTLQEDRYQWPDGCHGDGCHDNQHNHHHRHMQPTQSSCLKVNDVAYIHDKIGLHRIENPSHVERAASLHLYCPPYGECRTFDERTGHARTCRVTFYTKYGKKTEANIKDMTGTGTGTGCCSGVTPNCDTMEEN